MRGVIGVACALAFAMTSPARAQVGDPPPLPPPPPLLDESGERQDPADEGEAPLEAPQIPARPPITTPLPPPDVPHLDDQLCPSAPSWPLAAGAAGLAGGVTFSAAASVLLALSWWSSTESGPQAPLVPIALLVGATTLPFLAGLGAGLAMLPLGRPVLLRHFVELCGVCAGAWAFSLCVVGAALSGGGGGCGSPSCGGGDGCGDPFGLGGDDRYRTRHDVYWAAGGAALGAAIGGTLLWLGSYGPSMPSADLEVWAAARVLGVAALGSVVGGALGAAYGAIDYEEELKTSSPAACRTPAPSS